MRVCLDIRVQTKGGTSTFITNFVRQLMAINSKHEFVFLTHQEFGAIQLNNYEVIKVPRLHPLLELSWVQSILPFVLKKQGIELYHSLKHLGPRYSPVKSIYRNAAVGQFGGIYPLSLQERIYWCWLEKKLYNSADLIIAVSNYIRTFLIEHLNISEDKIITVHNGRDEYFRLLSKEEIPDGYLSKKGLKHPFILCVGNVLPVKNYKTMILAFKKLKDDYSIDEVLVIAGGTYHPYFNYLQNLVSTLELQDSVRFIGFQSLEDLRYLYNSAKLLVHPSLHEGFSFTGLEAMGCGVPVVCANTTSNPELAEDTAIYYDSPEDSDELADKIQGLLGSKELRESLSKKSIKRIKQFSWKKCVKDTISVYESL